jgi:hypothetical protein
MGIRISAAVTNPRVPLLRMGTVAEFPPEKRFRGCEGRCERSDRETSPLATGQLPTLAESRDSWSQEKGEAQKPGEISSPLHRREAWREGAWAEAHYNMSNIPPGS